MYKIAIIQFPGINTEYETRREIMRAGMHGEFFRWNEDAAKLRKYDGFVIGGGFAYEDRGRAGIIASLDPIMETIRQEAERGKPVLGICNGAQILVESGLIPGADGNKLAMALARNRRVRDGKIVGTGFFNKWVYMKCVSKKGSCVFTENFHEGEIITAPIAHAEGRFTSEIPDLMLTLQAKNQMVFRYCDRSGIITEDYPVNPNGAMFNLAALTNPAGNVMGIMPHLERSTAASEKLFTSLRDSLSLKKSTKRIGHLTVKIPDSKSLQAFSPADRSFEMRISLIITDNEAETFELTLKKLGFSNVEIKRKTHVEIGYDGKPDFQKLTKKLTQSGVLLNTNKETAQFNFPKTVLKRLFQFASKKTSQEAAEEKQFTFRLLVREKSDFTGMAKLATLRDRLKFSEIRELKTGTLWEIHVPTKSKNKAEDEFRRIIKTRLFWNPHRQEAYEVA